MKKCLLVLMMLCAVSLFAGERDTLFDMMASGAQSSLPEGATMRKDTSTYTLYFDIRVQADSQQINNEVLSTVKAQMLQNLQGSNDAKIIKEQGFTLIINIITTDRKSYPVTITGLDL